MIFIFSVRKHMFKAREHMFQVREHMFTPLKQKTYRGEK